ncbi:riboflavin synthase [Segetibacter sp. 3557_3]|uniref:riboflavin synthase n=1 Tax=Segetibacter sp. 3557_3 TaxID=2547429 RepID=UPI001058EA4C|nr:riboflavin synthase [Segetibacter sp. 3557_3]TDH27812.1 riboflavin synthase [Segetibacter sp. 3557_3]
MFTGIIETLGTVENVTQVGTNKTFHISSAITPELKVDQSVSHNGVCLTVEGINGNVHQVTAIAETLNKTNLGSVTTGQLVNLERCMQMNGRIDGHLVQGHVDTTAMCLSVTDLEGSWQYRFEFNGAFSGMIIEKGSISLNGISLTIFDVTKSAFSVAIIPYTYQHTNMRELEEGSPVNIEFDMIGKYVQRFMTVS